MPPDYVYFVIDIDAPGMHVQLVNEFLQEILLIRIEMLCFKIKISGEQMLMNIYLEDFFIKDQWSGKKDYEYLMYLQENTELCVDDPEGSGKAIAVSYKSNSNFEICPFHVNATFQKGLFVVAPLPAINELIRTLFKSFSGNNLDLKYYKKAATKRLKKLASQATTQTKISKQLAQVENKKPSPQSQFLNSPRAILISQ